MTPKGSFLRLSDLRNYLFFRALCGLPFPAHPALTMKSSGSTTSKILLPLFFISTFSPLPAQTTEWKWSVERCGIHQANDSAFLVGCEKKMWTASFKQNSFREYMGMFSGAGYNVRIPKAEAASRFADTTIEKPGFPG